MKTSYILLAIIAVMTLTGMIATDVLLKQQYDKIDWRDPYQDYEQRALPNAKHWVIEGVPTEEIVIEQTIGKPQVLLTPKQTKFYRSRQQGDTVFIAFTPDYSGEQSQPRDEADRKLYVAVLMRLPHVQTLRATNARLTLSEFTADKLAVSLSNSRLRTQRLTISDAFTLTVSQHSFAVLGAADQYKSVHAVVQDSSGVQLNNTPIQAFTSAVSPKAEMQLRGQALKWLR